ncbi:hypothetical protein D0A37_24405 [Microcoleus vaginatus HSN003]|nr:hypothetical protein D0A37_24405 [Microcoleus vaginatus HSN003]
MDKSFLLLLYPVFPREDKLQCPLSPLQCKHRGLLFLSVLDAPSPQNGVSTVGTTTMLHQRVAFDKAFMRGENATLPLIASA